MNLEKIKYYRLIKGYSQQQLADLCGLTKMSISHYEQGKREPENMEIINRICEVLDISVSTLIKDQYTGLNIKYGEFRKNTKLSKKDEMCIKYQIEDYLTRFYNILDILGEGNIEPSPRCSILELSNDIENDAYKLRKHLYFPIKGPIGNLINHLEDIGIIVVLVDVDNDNFSGINGTINNRPYIAVNKNMTPTRIRFTLVHELVHLMFVWPKNLDQKETEKICNKIAGAFLFSKESAIRELGIRRYSVSISRDMIDVCEEYQISFAALIKRAELCGIITKKIYKDFCIRINKNGLNKKELFIPIKEETKIFRQLVLRAASEEEISISKAAELLNINYFDVLNMINMEASNE